MSQPINRKQTFFAWFEVESENDFNQESIAHREFATCPILAAKYFLENSSIILSNAIVVRNMAGRKFPPYTREQIYSDNKA